MKESIKIYELNSDLLERKFKFWNTFKITLYEDRIFFSRRGLFGINYQEKTFAINNLDSLFLKKKFSLYPLILAFLFLGVVSIIFSAIDVNNETRESWRSLIILTGIVFCFIGQKQFVVSSNNDKMGIQFSVVPKQKLNELTEKALQLKKKFNSNNFADASLKKESSNQEDFSEKLNKLKVLLNQGIIDENEFQEQKSKILANI